MDSFSFYQLTFFKQFRVLIPALSIERNVQKQKTQCYTTIQTIYNTIVRTRLATYVKQIRSCI